MEPINFPVVEDYPQRKFHLHVLPDDPQGILYCIDIYSFLQNVEGFEGLESTSVDIYKELRKIVEKEDNRQKIFIFDSIFINNCFDIKTVTAALEFCGHQINNKTITYIHNCLLDNVNRRKFGDKVIYEKCRLLIKYQDVNQVSDSLSSRYGGTPVHTALCNSYDDSLLSLLVKWGGVVFDKIDIEHQNQASRLLWLSILWFVLEFITRIIARYNGAPVKTAKTKDRGSWLLVALSSIFLFGVISLNLSGVTPDLPEYLFPIGIALMLLGYALRIWAVITLGKFFTMKVMIFKNHQLIDKGPYRWLQHPSYSGVFLTALGFGLASGYLLILITFLIVLSYVLGYRIYVEEKALREQFGKDWTSYQAKRWRILPWII